MPCSSFLRPSIFGRPEFLNKVLQQILVVLAVLQLFDQRFGPPAKLLLFHWAHAGRIMIPLQAKFPDIATGDLLIGQPVFSIGRDELWGQRLKPCHDAPDFLH